MGKQLTVIVGAGASYDLIPDLGGASLPTANATVNLDYRPPLTADLFTYRMTFQSVLERYPGALSLAATIKRRVNRGEGLEAVLKSLRDSREENNVRRFRQIPLFLQELFGIISQSDRFTSEPVNYTSLMHEVLVSAYDKVAFVTLNYDLFLERSLQGVDGTRFASLDSYVSPQLTWMLVKLHGSANWGRRLEIPNLNVVAVSHDQVLRHIDEIPLENYLADEVEFLPRYDVRWTQEWGLIYPAITVPVEGKYEFVCPDPHIEALREFWSSCRNFLIIGVSGRDQDLLDLLSDSVEACTWLAIVGTNDVEQVHRRFAENVDAFRGVSPLLYPNGFSNFIQGGEFDDFLRRLE